MCKAVRINDFNEEFTLFWHLEKGLNTYLNLVKFQLGGEHFDEFVKNNEPIYKSFEDLLRDCGM